MDKSGWTVEDEKAYQQLALRRNSQMPVLPAGSSGAMTDASKRRADDAGFELESDWEVGSSLMEPVGGIEDLATKALLPAGVRGRQDLPLESMRRRRQITTLSSTRIPAMSHGAANI